MTYNSKILHEQGGSVLRVDSGGSIAVQAGGTISGAGTVSLTGGIAAASVTVSAAGAFTVNGIQILADAITSPPTESAVPGSIFLRSDGSVSNVYINTSTGAAGSVWSATCVNLP